MELIDGRLIVKDADGTTVATFKDEAVSGWWIEDTPADWSKLTESQLEALLKFTEERMAASGQLPNGTGTVTSPEI